MPPGNPVNPGKTHSGAATASAEVIPPSCSDQSHPISIQRAGADEATAEDQLDQMANVTAHDDVNTHGDGGRVQLGPY